MRPRPNDRGNCAPLMRNSRGRFASMRPRPNDRGNPKSRQRRGWQADASMRPRPNDRGNGQNAIAPCASMPGFNEAAAERPRKSQRGALGRGKDDGFNEAAAERPRKSEPAGRLRGRLPASMRPRPNDRGNWAVAGGTNDEQRLQ